MVSPPEADRAGLARKNGYHKEDMADLSKAILFVVERDPDGGLVACSEGECIVTQAEDLESLKGEIRDAVCCHFEDRMVCPTIRLRMDGEEFDL